jgi:aryl-alcohol dehydrogenase-like predicted oxidoreductase
MYTRPLGNTGLQVTEIGYGAAQVGNRDLPEHQAERILKAVLDAGINFIDTAAMYGISEERIGKYISSRKDEFIVATKCGDYQIEEAGKWRTVKDYTPKGITQTIDESRKKLNMDVIDIVQFHGLPGEEDDTQAAFDALLEAQSKGWTRFIGASQDGPSAADAARRYPLDTQEFTYNILFQEADTIIFPTLRERGAGAIIKRPISNAVYLLSERPEGNFNGVPWDRAQQFSISDLAGDTPLVDFALQFTLAHPDVSTAIIGSTNIDHLRANASLTDRLSPDTVAKAQNLWSELFARS